MKRLSPILAVFVLLTLAGCQSPAWKAMDLAWPEVRVDAEYGGANPSMLDSFETSLADRDRMNVLFLWPPIRQDAFNGIEAQVDDGVVGPNVADTLNRRVIQFDRAVSRVTQ